MWKRAQTHMGEKHASHKHYIHEPRLNSLAHWRSNQNKIHKCLNYNRADFRIISYIYPGQQEMAPEEKAKTYPKEYTGIHKVRW